MKKVHELKIRPLYFDAVNEGRKTFEIRKNDRGFQNSDLLMLREWSPEEGYSSRSLEFEVGYVFPLSEYFGPENDYVILSLLPYVGDPLETASRDGE